MKIEYNNIKFISFFNEIYGTLLYKNKLLKRKYKCNKTLLHILEEYVLASIIVVLLLTLAMILNKEDDTCILICKCLSNLIIFLCFFLCIYYLIIGIIYYFNMKNNSNNGYIKISKDGIEDVSKDKYDLFYNYNMIDLMALTNNYVFFLIKNNTIIYLSNENIKREELIEKVREYSNIKIIDNTGK